MELTTQYSESENNTASIKRPLFINILICFHSIKFFYLLASFLFIWSMGKNGLIPGITPLILTRLFLFTFTILLLHITQAFGLFYMRKWARFLIIFLIIGSIFSKTSHLFLDVDLNGITTSRIFESKKPANSKSLSKKDIEYIKAVIKESGTVKISQQNKNISPSIKVLGNLLNISRQELTTPGLRSYSHKATIIVLILIDIMLLLYFTKRKNVSEAFKQYGSMKFAKVFHIKQIVISIFAILFICIIADRTYAFIMWKIAKIPDHLTSYPTTMKTPLQPDPALVKDFKEYIVEGCSIYLPTSLSAYRPTDAQSFSALFINKDMSFLCGISPLKYEEYKLRNIPKKARWNPVLLLLKGVSMPEAGSEGIPATQFIHSDNFTGNVTKTYQKNNRVSFDYDIMFDEKKGLAITFYGSKKELNEELLNSIVAGIKPVDENKD